MTGGELLALAGLGAFHGLNPGMGWLFAVAIALQHRSRAALLRALPAIAAGHAAAVAVVAVAVAVSGSVLTSRALGIGGGLLLVGFGLWRLLSRRHFRWAGMRLSSWQLASWSFLMSSVHGAGLMLLPVLVHRDRGQAGATGDAPAAVAGGGAHQHAHQHAPGAGAITGSASEPSSLAGDVLAAVGATALHTLAMVAVAGLIAVAVYELAGLRILRTAWINLDRIWAFALLGAGAATVLLA